MKTSIQTTTPQDELPAMFSSWKDTAIAADLYDMDDQFVDELSSKLPHFQVEDLGTMNIKQLRAMAEKASNTSGYGKRQGTRR